MQHIAMSAESALTALSPLDGRYAGKVAALREHFSEFGLIRSRVEIEVAWLLALAAEPAIAEVPPFDDATRDALAAAVRDFAPADAARVKAIERTTNHDVKAIEYWMKERFAGVPAIARVSEFIHFACTSEDINNLAHGMALAARAARRAAARARRDPRGPALARARARRGADARRARTASRRRRPRSARKWPTSPRASRVRSPRSSACRCSAR